MNFADSEPNESQRAAQWEAIYRDLDALLSRLPFAKMDGAETYYIVEHGDGQHKVECQAEEYFEAAILSSIQDVIRTHASEWEVILVGGPLLGPQQAVSIYSQSIVPRWSTAQWYGDA